MKKYLSLFVFIGILVQLSYAQQKSVELQWDMPVEYDVSDTETVKILSFQGAASFTDYGALPVYLGIFDTEEGSSYSAELTNMIFEPLPLNQYDARDLELAGDDIKVLSFHKQKKNQLYVYVLPVRKNMLTGTWERLVSFSVGLVPEKATSIAKEAASFADNSKLSDGNWYKIYVPQDGMYQLSYSDLETLGLPVNSLDPATIKIYGNGGGIVPENNSDDRLDDLNEIAISVSGENDGSFDSGDRITFYGESPHKWTYNPVNKTFEQEVNPYSTRNGYFITYGGDAGKRIAVREQSSSAPTNTVTKTDYFLNHELEEVNLIGSGREWYGEIFDIQTSYKLSFEIPDLDQSEPVDFYTRLAGRSTTSSSFDVSVNGSSTNVSIRAVSLEYGSTFAFTGTVKKSFDVTGNSVDVDIKYNKPVSSANGWLDRIRINARRALRFYGGQMPFCDSESAYYGNIAKFVISNANSSVKVYDISDHQNVARMDTDLNGSELTFVADASELYRYIAVENEYLTPELGGAVENQNLHAHQPVNMVIVTHPEFSSQANRLAEFHNNRGLTTRVVDVFKIYNEFSCGTQDITAIRDYMRMLYDRSSGESGLKYLLLFGDASYDYLDRVPDNTNFIPTWESINSEDATNSYATDDYFGCLDPGEGKFISDELDIGIGRLVVTNIEEAAMAVDKIINYSVPSEETHGDWRNNITIVADDEDDNLHIRDADRLARFVDTTARAYNINKVYIDSYQQVIASGGERYPDANEAINTNMAKGNLIMNYVGHGGEIGWALERILELTDINSWTNYDKLALFITATCEFSRFDDPERVSAGEQVFLNPDGGGVALMTTSRATFASSNYTLNRSIYANAFKKENGEYPRLGDLLRKSKIAAGSAMNAQKFILIGDPAMQLAYPELKVETTHFNGEPINQSGDTIKALDFVTISGRVYDDNGKTANSFNGVVYPTIYDKPSQMTSLGNDDNSSPFDFEQMNRILYRGQAEVIDGEFSFSFQVPKDINYSYGNGKISYYVSDEFTDGNGYDEHFIIGGFNNSNQNDEKGPEIKLFINDPYFSNGGLTNSDPLIYAEIFDESGINVGTGIGHDITAVLDSNYDKIYVLNDFYQGVLNSYQAGTVEYPLFNLAPGAHTLELKVWDALNNSSTAQISFVVAGENNVILDNLNCYPNPFSASTKIFFEHNQSGEMLTMDYMIFDFSGRLVFDRTVTEETKGYRTSSVTWNGTNNSGSYLPGGIYICKLIVTNEEGVSSAVTGKFVLTR